MYFVYDLKKRNNGEFKFRNFYDSVGFETLRDAYEYASRKGIVCAKDNEIYLFETYTPKNVLEETTYYLGLAKIDMNEKVAHEKALQKFNKIEIN